MRVCRNLAFAMMALLALILSPVGMSADGEACEAVAAVPCQVDVPDWYLDDEAFCAAKCPDEPHPVGECTFSTVGCGGDELKYNGNCSCSASPIIE